MSPVHKPAEPGPMPSQRPTSRAESSFQDYQDFAVGSRSWWALLRYEILAGWGALLPGALGLVVRRGLWPSLFAHIGSASVWGHNVVLRHPGKMWLGRNVRIDNDCLLDAKGCAKGDFRIDDDVVVSRGCQLAGKDAWLHIGPRANIGTGCMISSAGGLRIGADSILAGNCYIGGGAYEPDLPIDRPIQQHRRAARPVEIGDGCWLGAGVIVIEGVRIGQGSVIGAGSVVTREIPPFSIATGVPAKVRRQRRYAAGSPAADAGAVGQRRSNASTPSDRRPQ